MDDDRVRDFWDRSVATTGIDGEYTAWTFGDDATELGLLVRDGPKRATTSLLSGYEDEEPLPKEGDLSVVLDGNGEPLCVIRTTQVEVRRFGDVDEEFAWTEGEGSEPQPLASRSYRVLRQRGDGGRRRHSASP